MKKTSILNNLCQTEMELLVKVELLINNNHKIHYINCYSDKEFL